MQNDIKTIVLNNEQGEQEEFEVITKLDIENKEYVIVVPKNEDVDEAVALKIDRDDEGNDILVTIDDEKEFELVAEAYELLFSQDDEKFN